MFVIGDPRSALCVCQNHYTEMKEALYKYCCYLLLLLQRRPFLIASLFAQLWIVSVSPTIIAVMRINTDVLHSSIPGVG